MKKLITILYISLIGVFSANAQMIYQTYSNGDMSINIQPGKSQGKMYMDINEIGIILNAKSRSAYLEFLKESFAKFSEWSGVANENNITDMKKDIREFRVSGYFQYGGWKFGSSKHRSIFRIQEDGTHVCYVYIGKFQAGSNQYMKSTPTMYYLTQELIDELTQYLNEENIETFIKLNNTTEDLFKN